MTIQMVLLPVFVQVALTFALLFWMAMRAHAQRQERRDRRSATSRSVSRPGPTRPQQISNSYNSQFQIPLLFYVLVILALYHAQADLIFVVMAWLFVLARIAHAYVHTTSNHVRRASTSSRSACSCCSDVDHLRGPHSDSRKTA